MASVNSISVEPQRLEEILAADPVQAKAFLTGLEAGYTLGLCQGEEKKEGSDK